jgi:hypothetical protein
VRISRLYLLACAAALISPAMIWSGCSIHRAIHKEEIRRQVKAARSLASESGMFVSLMRSSKITPAFVRAHTQYLTEESHRLLRGLERPPAAEAARPWDALRTQVQRLERELSSLAAQNPEPGSLAVAEEHLDGVRRALDGLFSSL